MNKPSSNEEKQYTILPNEADPKKSFAKAYHAVSKALTEIQKTRKVKANK